MLHIVLMILAGFVKLLLVLLALILLLVLLILFVPFRYRGQFQKQEQTIQGHAAVFWLMKLLQVRVSFAERKMTFDIRVLGISPFRLLKRIRGRKEKREPSQTEESRKKSDLRQELSEEQQRTAENLEELEQIPDTVTEQAQTEGDSKTPESKNGKAGERISKAEEQKANGKIDISERLKRLRGLPGCVKTAVLKMREKAETLCLKTESLKNKADQAVTLLGSKLFQEVFGLTRKEILAVVRHAAPRKIRGRLEYGTGDPGTTGELLAVLASVYPLLPGRLTVCPDFEETVLNCDLSLAGRIRLIVPLFHGGRLLLNKQFRYLIKKVRHRGHKNG